MLEIRNLSKRFKKIIAVKELTLTVDDGEIVGLVGPNGSGKTTTMHCALALLEWDSGEVLIDGHDMIKEHVEARKRLGFVPAKPSLFTDLTVWQHIAFVARAYRTTNWEARAMDLLERFELMKKKDELVGELSLGQGQKLWCICVFVTMPKVLFMDEPFSGMDPRGVRTMKELLLEHKRNGGCALISSHQLAILEEICDRVALISDGEILAMGPIPDLKEKVRLSKDSNLEDLYLKITDILGAEAR